jgi:HEAT repeat protein
MNTIEFEPELLRATDPAAKINFIESLGESPLTDEQLNHVCKFIADEDKGLRNAISFLLSFNGDSKIPRKIVPFISSADISVRNFIGDVLIKIGDGAVEALLDYLGKGNDDDKKFVIDVLGLIGNDRAKNNIIEILNTNENENIVLACIEALGNIRSEESIPNLISYYAINELYKPTIIEALGKIGSPDALNFILSKYDEEDELTKFSIIESLGTLGDEDAFFFLLSELNETKSSLIWPILKAIYSLKEKFGFDIPFDEKMRNVILSIIFEANNEYKKIAAMMLSVFNDKEIISVYLKIIGEDPQTDEIITEKVSENPEVFFSLIGTYVNERPENIQALLNVLKEVVQFHFRRISSILSPLQLRDIVDSLSQLISDYEEEVRILAFELLYLFDKETALLFADDLCEDQNYWNRLKLIELIEENELPKVNEILQRLAEDSEEMIREKASLCLINRLNT